KGLNPFADFAFADFGNIDTKPLLHLKAYDKAEVKFRLGYPSKNQESVIHINKESQHHNIIAQSFIFKESFDLLKLRHYLTVMLFVQGAFFYRIKGILNIEGFNRQL